jgi:hypothetical protein
MALFGPESIPDTGDTQVYYTCPAGKRAMLRYVHVSNPGGTTKEMRLAIGDANNDANVFFFRGGGDPIPADSIVRKFFQIWLNPGETIQGYPDSAGLVLRLDGYERPAG